MSMSSANMTIWKLIDNDDAMYAEHYQVTCDECATLVSEDQYEDQYDEHDGLCDRCYDAVHFTCAECGEEHHCDDHHTTYPSLCDGCGDTKCREVADELWALIEDLVGSWSGEDTEITRLQKLLKYAKKLK